MADAALFPSSFRSFALVTQTSPEVTIRGITSGDAASSLLPPLMLLHGFPQTHHIWHRVAPQLTSHFTVVMPDLRGYGQSSKPAGVVGYAKSAMARDMVSVMDQLGYASQPFYIVGHDRGARVAHKLLVDHPGRGKAAILLDVSPTLRMYEATDARFASAYDHWFFLIQKAPFPETLIAAHPGVFLDKWLGRGVGARAEGAMEGLFDSRCLNVYTTCLGDPETARAMCEDYRAAWELDVEEQRADKAAGRVIKSPLRVYWASRGVVDKLFNCVQDWQDVTDSSIRVEGHALESGHFIPEERPDDVVKVVMDMFA